jgi:Carboxypeptidase regulatory-like domain
VNSGRVITRVWWLCVLLIAPRSGLAQEAALTGSVTDSSGGVLPGVTVIAVHLASGNQFVAVTDERGGYHIPLRIGDYQINADLPGFKAVVKTAVVQVGQTAIVNLQMSMSALQESIVVSGEAPLVNTASSTLGGNIDRRQMQDLPINGRNWMDLALLAPGSRQNESSNIPQARQGYSQINIDGQQITHLIPGTDQNQPSYSMDAIAEFVVVTNRFDATQGRSSGMLANAVTKSGTNTYAGTIAGYFRSDRLNASDFIQKRVVPYQDQQIATTFGGPFRKDRIHFFVNYEQERQPQTVTFSSPYPAFNIDLPAKNRQRKGIARGDVQFSARTHFMVRFQKYYNDLPNSGTGGASSHPSTARREQRHSNELFSALTSVLGVRAVNEIKGGASLFNYTRDAAVTWKGGCFPDAPVRCGGSKTISLRGYSIGQAVGQDQTQNNYSVRDDFTFSFDKGGRQDVKIGGEYIRQATYILWCATCTGNLDATNGPVPAAIASLFPVWNDASTWNLAPLSSISRRFTMNVSNANFHYRVPQNLYAGWLQDDWKVSRHLTLNLGIRYDVQVGANSEGAVFKPWINDTIPYDLNNVGPRLGFALTLDDKTVVRGGYGVFYAQASTDEGHQTEEALHQAAAEILYDGRADFAANPFNGPAPTFEQVISNACDQNGGAPGCYRRSITDEINNKWRRMPHAQQGSIGLQRQVGSDVSVEANYVYTGGRGEEVDTNINLSYNPATGVNYPSADVTHRPFPQWGIVPLGLLEGYSNYHGLETSFNKRFSHRWQAQGTYTLSAFRDGTPQPDGYSIVDGSLTRTPLGFTVAKDIAGEHGLATSDQRHRAVFNGIYAPGLGIQVSGLYFYGSGSRMATRYGSDVRDVGFNLMATQRLRPDGSIIPRNNLVGQPIHRVDLRAQKSIGLGRYTISGIVDIFNVFNRANYGSYTLTETSAGYGKPSYNSNLAYQARMLQFGFRLAF